MEVTVSAWRRARDEVHIALAFRLHMLAQAIEFVGSLKLPASTMPTETKIFFLSAANKRTAPKKRVQAQAVKAIDQKNGRAVGVGGKSFEPGGGGIRAARRIKSMRLSSGALRHSAAHGKGDADERAGHDHRHPAPPLNFRVIIVTG